MIIDSHAHYEPRLLPVDKLLESMEANGVSKTVLVPCLTNPPESAKPAILMMIQRHMFYRDALRPLAIRITQGMYRQPGQWNPRLLGGSLMKNNKAPLEIIMNPDNEMSGQLIKRYPEKFMAWIFVNASRKNALQEIEKWKTVRGMVGVKLHPFWHHFSLKTAEPIASYAQAHRLPLNIHLGLNDLGACEWLLEKFPLLKIVFGHLGVPFYKRLWPLVKKYRNAFLDVASMYHVDQWLIQNAVRSVGPQRILFGTDIPYSPAETTRSICSWISSLRISEKEKEQIFSGNFLELTS